MSYLFPPDDLMSFEELAEICINNDWINESDLDTLETDDLLDIISEKAYNDFTAEAYTY